MIVGHTQNHSLIHIRLKWRNVNISFQMNSWGHFELRIGHNKANLKARTEARRKKSSQRKTSKINQKKKKLKKIVALKRVWSLECGFERMHNAHTSFIFIWWQFFFFRCFRLLDAAKTKKKKKKKNKPISNACDFDFGSGLWLWYTDSKTKSRLNMMRRQQRHVTSTWPKI